MDEVLAEWLKDQPLAEILEENNLTEEDVVRILWKYGHIELPLWLEQKIEYEDSDE